jgi:hypothetical protein
MWLLCFVEMTLKKREHKKSRGEASALGIRNIFLNHIVFITSIQRINK